MRPIYTGIDLFLHAVLRGTEPGVLSHVRWLRKSPGYECPSATELSVHLILGNGSAVMRIAHSAVELYDESSSVQDNTVRICSNLEMEADQLMHLSKRVKGLA